MPVVVAVAVVAAWVAASAEVVPVAAAERTAFWNNYNFQPPEPAMVRGLTAF